ncbi:sugar kinase [Thalassotalea profundi]|uniref:2-dehydro-3-deoxygluconokinase n=1 Tax=Thalassotalea profundi TaxID=2036687 RepID=A0ABQ3IYW4_9GAMM|nr:sugar kinase [Thalassotalea profundi]GHE95747.1 2-dehydro-3-deoxygluconokinase [Thalassotalea profundi]
MSNIYVFGECMIELRVDKALNSSQNDTSSKILKQAFAGDVLNTAIYLKRTFPALNAHFVSAVGHDKFSVDMLNFLKEEHIGCDFVFQSDNKIPGLYAIETDETGERTFNYWRENSAAKEVMPFITQDVIGKLAEGDMFFFSGISLAVITASDRPLFWKMLAQLKSAGVSIVFDPNYRARMWETPEQAKEQFEKAFSLSDIALPGVDDFQQLYGIKTADEVYNFCQQFNFEELVIKNGEAEILCYHQGKQYQFSVIPVTNVVDTTSAGDSFNGAYLGARINKQDIDSALKIASQAAGFVIQHQGAIVPKVAFTQFIEKQLP